MLIAAAQNAQAARIIWDAVRAAGIPIENHAVGYQSSGFLPYAEEDYDEVVIEAPANWVLQLKAIVVASVTPQILRWPPNFGVSISPGSLEWFCDSGGSFRQSWDEFLAAGFPGHWIDRAMPDELRRQLYVILGAAIPPEKTTAEKCAEIEHLLATWAGGHGTGEPACTSCTTIPSSS